MQKKIDASIKAAAQQNQSTGGRIGIIQSYDPRTNTATVMLTAPDSDTPGDIITNVMCPVLMGLQLASPEPGRPCWVVFRGSNDKAAVIVNYFNHMFSHYDYNRLYDARSAIPKYMSGI